MTEQQVRRYLRQMDEEDSERAFNGFFDLTHDRLFRTAFYFLHREDEAQEVVLKVFLKLWERRHELLSLNNIEDYCFTLTKNEALNTLKARSHTSVSLDSTEETHFSVISEASSPEQQLIDEELFARYVKALDRLPKAAREVFIAIREEGKSYAEVAKERGISLKTVDAELQKAIVKLKALLQL